MSTNRAAIAALLAAIFIVFRALPGHDFINFDDNSYVSENHYVRDGLTSESVRAAFTETFNGHWHPLTMLSYMLDTAVFGPGPGGYHFTNLALHAANTLVLLFLLHNITGAFWPSYLVAALFALHPAHVEPVAWIASRKDLLSTLFFLLTMQAHASYTRNPKRATYAIASVCLVLGLLSKAMLVTVPAVLLLMDYWPLRRIDFAGEMRWRAAAKLVGEKWLYFVIAIVFSAVTIFTQSHAGTMTSFEDLSLSARLFNAVRAYGDYLRIAVWPARLAPFYPHSGHVESFVNILPAITVLIAATVISVAFARRAPYLIVGWLFFLGTLIPVSGLMQAGIQSYADRYTYIPFTGLDIMAAWGLRDLASRWVKGPRVVAVACAAVLIGCAVISFRQASFWKDDVRLFEHTLAVTQKNYVAHMILGNAYTKAGRADDAIEQFRAGIAIEPLDADLHASMAIALGNHGDVQGSRKAYLETLRINPAHVVANTNVGALLGMQGDHAEAVAFFERALEVRPDFVPALSGLGLSLSELGKYAEAEDVLDRGLKIDPAQANLHKHLGLVYAKTGRDAEASAASHRALELNPADPDTLNSLGVLAARESRFDEAIGYFERAVALDPEHAAAANLKQARKDKNAADLK